MVNEIPQMNEIYRKEFKCFHCKMPIVLDGIRNKYLGIDEIVTEQSELLRIIQSQNDEFERIASMLQSEHKRANVLYERVQKLKALATQHAMFFADGKLLKELNKY